MDIQEVVVVLNHHAINEEYGVVVATIIDVDAQLFAYNIVGTLLLAKEPNVDIGASAVLRHGIDETKPVALEYKHLNTLLVIYICKLCDSF